MGIFDSLAVRENGKKIYAAWANDIRTALRNVFGDNVVAETEFTIADNQSSWANITGLSFDGATYGHAEIEYNIYRDDGSSDERKESGRLVLNYKPRAQTWSLTRKSEDDDALNISGGGIQLDVTGEVAQVQYQSDSMGGSYTGIFTYRVIKCFAVQEA